MDWLWDQHPSPPPPLNRTKLRWIRLRDAVRWRLHNARLHVYNSLPAIIERTRFWQRWYAFKALIGGKRDHNA